MNAPQIALTTDLILEEFWYLTVEEIKHCLRKAMRTAKVYDRLDGNIIIGWIREYDYERDEVMVQLNVEEKNRLENGPVEDSGTGISYEEYVAGVKARAAAGDEEAVEILKSIELNEAHRKSFDKGLSHDEFRRWYLTEYLPNKSKKQQ